MSEIDEADDLGHTERAGRLRDETERARKTVSARLRDSLAKIQAAPRRSALTYAPH